MVMIFVLVGVFVVALGLMLLVFARQQGEKKKMEIQRRIRTLSDRGRQMQILLEEIPPHYLSQDFRVFIVTQWQDLLQEQKELGSKESQLKTEMETAKQKLAAIRESQPQAEPVGDIKIANGVRRNLKQLNKIIVGLYQEKKIPHRVAQGYLNEIKQAFTQTLVEVFKASASQAEASGNLRTALVHHKRIMSELNRSNPNGIHNQTLLECRETIKKLEERIAVEEENNSSNKLAAGVGELIEKEDSWKKKQLYDD